MEGRGFGIVGMYAGVRRFKAMGTIISARVCGICRRGSDFAAQIRHVAQIPWVVDEMVLGESNLCTTPRPLPVHLHPSYTRSERYSLHIVLSSLILLPRRYALSLPMFPFPAPLPSSPAKCPPLPLNGTQYSCPENPTLSATERTSALSSIVPSSASPILTNLLSVLSENGRLASAPKVFADFGSLMSAYRGELEVVVTSAEPLDGKATQRIEKALKGTEIVQGKTLKIVNRVCALDLSVRCIGSLKEGSGGGRAGGKGSLQFACLWRGMRGSGAGELGVDRKSRRNG